MDGVGHACHHDSDAGRIGPTTWSPTDRGPRSGCAGHSGCGEVGTTARLGSLIGSETSWRRSVDGYDGAATLTAFADAWNRHDADALMSMMTDDPVFEASSGNDVDGERHQGQQAVRAAYATVFTQFPDAHWGNARHLVAGDRGVSEWTFTGTRSERETHRGQRMRPVHVSRRQDCREELVQKESTSDRVTSFPPQGSVMLCLPAC